MTKVRKSECLGYYKYTIHKIQICFSKICSHVYINEWQMITSARGTWLATRGEKRRDIYVLVERKRRNALTMLSIRLICVCNDDGWRDR